jgi:hypothetical protein
MMLALVSVGYSFHSSSLFTERELKDPMPLAMEWRGQKAQQVRSLLESNSVVVLETVGTANCDTNKLRAVLVSELNRMLVSSNLVASRLVSEGLKKEEIASLVEQNPQGDQRARMNRVLLEKAFANVLPQKAKHRGINGYEILIGVLVFVGSFAFSMGVVGWVLISEIYPTRIRGRAMSFATGAVWAGCFLVSVTFPTLVDWKGALGDRACPELAFWSFAAMCVLAILFIWRFVPETKGRSLEEIEKTWSREPGA